MTSRRLCLTALAAALLASPAIASGCAAGFEPIDKVLGLRILSVGVDHPYPHPGDTVHFDMTYYDGAVDPDTGEAIGPRPVFTMWLAGCFDPEGDQYYFCYPELAKLFSSIDPNAPMLPESPYLALGPGLKTFDLEIPKDIITRRPAPKAGPRYGTAYVFFLACAGHLEAVPPEGTGLAGSFPVGCFEGPFGTKGGKRLGAESFVPGYTQIYVFDDGRPNENPKVNALNFDGKAIAEGEEPKAEPCAISDYDRRNPSCGNQDPYSSCTKYKLAVDVPDDIAEPDPESVGADGTPLREVVWVDYFVDKGDLVDGIALVSDAVKGRVGDTAVDWIPPPATALVHVWAVVHDSRGGETTIARTIHVN